MILLKYICTNLTKSITFDADVDGLVWKGKGKLMIMKLCFPLVLAFLLTQCKGKIYKAMNDWFSGVQNNPILIISINEMAKRCEIPAYSLKTPLPLLRIKVNKTIVITVNQNIRFTISVVSNTT